MEPLPIDSPIDKYLLMFSVNEYRYLQVCVCVLILFLYVETPGFMGLKLPNYLVTSYSHNLNTV